MCLSSIGLVCLSITLFKLDAKVNTLLKIYIWTYHTTLYAFRCKNSPHPILLTSYPANFFFPPSDKHVYILAFMIKKFAYFLYLIFTAKQFLGVFTFSCFYDFLMMAFFYLDLIWVGHIEESVFHDNRKLLWRLHLNNNFCLI